MLEEKRSSLEALLFVSGGPLEIRRAAMLLELPPDTVEALILELADRYSDSALQIVPLAGGYQMCTRAEYADVVEALIETERTHLSRAAMETLAIVAYKQPVTRVEVDAIRGVNSDGVMSRLCSYGLLETRGRKDTVGRPVLYGTTSKFLQHFGLQSLEELPEIVSGDDLEVNGDGESS